MPSTDFQRFDTYVFPLLLNANSENPVEFPTSYSALTNVMIEAGDDACDKKKVEELLGEMVKDGNVKFDHR